MQIPNFKRLCLYSLIAILGFLCSNTASAKNSPTLYLDTNQQSGYQVAAIQFLPDYEEYYNKKTTDQNYDSYDKCRQYTLTSCPANGICSTCTFDHSKYRLSSCKAGYKKSSDSKSCLQICGGLLKVLPEGQTCLEAYDGDTACYASCKAVCVSPYIYNKDDAASLHAATMSQAPACSSTSGSSSGSSMNYITINKVLVPATWKTNCGNSCYKIDSCESGYKLINGKCLNDECQADYYKTCETGTMGDPVLTDAGSRCYQCQPPKTPQEQCEELGYHTMDYWNEQDPQKTLFKPLSMRNQSYGNYQSRIASILSNLIGIKNAQASYFNANDTNLNLTNDGMKAVNVTNKINGGYIPADISKICTTIEDCSKKECANSTICSANLNGNATIKRDPASMFKTYEFKVTSTCEFDENYVKGSWVEVKNDVDDDETDDRTPQQKCEDEGYHNMVYWNKLKPSANGLVGRTSSLEFGSNRFAYLIKSILGIKNAQAIEFLEQVQGCPVYCKNSSTACNHQECIECGACPIGITPTTPNGGNTNKVPTEYEGEATLMETYKFNITDVCPYDENYVKGSWVAVKKCTENTCSGYTLDECPENGVCDKCTLKNTDCSSSGNKYKLTSCAEGYSISEDQTMCIKDFTINKFPTNPDNGLDIVQTEEVVCEAALGTNISSKCMQACISYVKRHNHAPSSCASLEQPGNNSLGILDDTAKNRKF